MNYPNKVVNASKADLLFQQAFGAHNAGRLEEAEAGYRKALRKAPSDFETLYLLGTVCSQQGKSADAVEFLRKALRIQPNHPDALNNLGLTLVGQEKPEEAADYFRQALKHRPNYLEAHCNLAKALELLGQLVEAEEHATKAIQLNPDFANGHYVLGLIMMAGDHLEAAVRCFLRGLELKPDFSSAYNDLGGIYKIWGRLDQAIECFNRAIELNPQAFNSYNNRGGVYEELGYFEEALVDYKKASAINPHDMASQWNTTFLYLRHGKLKEGWEAHEQRIRFGVVQDRFPYPVWDGSSPEAKTILVYAEQGIGDEIFFASCIPDIVARAKHVVIECDKRLAPLYARSFPTATIRGESRTEIGWLLEAPKIDAQVAVGSLARFFRPTLESFPQKPAYLMADPQKTEYWRNRMAMLGPGLKVGICWRSGLTKGERRKHYSELSQWGPIFGIPGLHFVKLQYDECTEELDQAEKQFGITIERVPGLDMKNELDETAALISTLDVVITANTAVCEMAGALGVETYRLELFSKPMDALGTGRSPSHPTMKLFCQTAGDWNTPIALIGEAVRDKVKGALQSVEFVPVNRNVEIAVNGSLDDLSTYVLKEHQGWWDAEYKFALDLIRPEMRVVDLAADIGAYAVPMASKAANGQVWALVHDASDASLLMKSRQKNGLERRLNITIADKQWSLDGEMDRHGLFDMDVVRLPADVCNVGTLEKGQRFFAVNSPLVMFGIRNDGNFGSGVTDWLTARGYRLYRLVPGLGILVPHASPNELDVFNTNLFACKDDRVDSLAQSGILIRQSEILGNVSGFDQPLWQEYLQKLPYAADRMQDWLTPSQKGKDWEVYWMALSFFAAAQAVDKSASHRYAYLQAAAGVLSNLVSQQANLARVLSLARVMIDLGKRAAAVDLLNQVCSLLHTGGISKDLNEPCLALTDAYGAIAMGDRPADWALAQILASREQWRAFSTFFTGQESLSALEEVQALGFADNDVTKRTSLIKKRLAGAAT